MKKIITVTEPISRDWNDEAIWIDAAAGSVAVNAADGTQLPSQFSGHNPYDFREEQRLCVKVNLLADQVLDIAVQPGTPINTANLFCVNEISNEIEISNGILSVIVPQSQSFDPGYAPGPVLSLSLNGKRHGKGSLGKSEYTGRIETAVIDVGPLFARWITRYIQDGKEQARYDCKLWAGEDFIHISESSRLDAGMIFHFEMAGCDTPNEWFSYGGGEQVAVVRGNLDNPPSPKGCKRDNELIHIDFHSCHFQMSYTWGGFILNDDTTIGIVELNSGLWEYPSRNRIKAMLNDDGGVSWLLPANGGKKDYALCCGSKADYAPETGLSKFCYIKRRISDLPLEKTRKWQTRWMPEKRERPLLYPVGTAENWREKLNAWPELDSAYRKMAEDLLAGKHVLAGAMLPAYLASGCKVELREMLIARMENDISEAVKHAVGNGYLRLIIFSGRMLKVDLETIDMLLSRGEIEPERAQKIIQKMLFISYCFADDNFWPYDVLFRETSDPLSMGLDYINDIGQSLGPPNFTTEYYTSFGLAGLTFPGHPAADEWIEQSVKQFERQLNFHFYESGAYIESLNYHHHALGMIEQVAIALKAAGKTDFFKHPVYKANYGFFQNMLTPPVLWNPIPDEPASGAGILRPMIAEEKKAMLHSWGNSGHDCCGYPIPSFLAVGAGIYADSDPAYAKSLMGAWHSGPGYFCTHYTGLNLVALGRPDIIDAPLNLKSDIVEGLGATFRSGQGTAEEIFAWVKCSTATHHNCRDEGGIVLYAYGAELLGDFGYHHQTADGKQAGGYHTWKHTCVTFDGNSTSAYTGVEKATPPELWRSTEAADLLVTHLPVDYIIPDGNAYLDTVHIPRIDHRRWILFCKPNYFLIFDHIPASTVPATWWLHALADDIDVGIPGKAYITGNFGVDLDVRMIVPDKAQFLTAEYGCQRHLQLEIPAGAGEFISILTPLAKGMTGPTEVRKTSENEILITGNWGEDRIYLSPAIGIPAPLPVKVTRNGKVVFEI
jgi:hypothetical protein